MKKPNILDRAIMTMAPVHAAKRAAARVALSVIKSGYGSYGANLTKKSMRGWMYHGGSAKEDIEDNIDILRQRSRDAYMGIPTATAAVISAMFTVFVKSQNPSDGRPFGEMIPAEELIDNADQSSIELGPGAIIDLNPGEEVQFADPKHPNTGYDDFTNATIRLIGAGLEIPPEVMMKQFTTSYSAARGALNEFWRTCSMQRDWFTDDFCQPVYEEWFAEAVARGRIHALGFFTDPARRKAYTACAWNGPARTNLNPVQEVDAAIKRVDAGFSTAQEETAQMTGGDYNRNIKLHMTEAKRKREVDEIGKAQTAGE